MRPRTWALAAVAGILLYVAIDVALVFLRPELSVLHNAESDYGSHGHYAWLMDVNFVVRFAFSAAAVLALGSRIGAGRIPLLVWAVGSGLLAFFPDDPVGTPQHSAGKVHGALALIVFVAVVVGTLMGTRALRALPDWRTVARTLTVLSWGAVVPILLLGRTRFRAHSLGGLYEKVFLAVEIAWLLVAALWAAKLPPDG
jgi:hypothetical protein